MLRVFLTFCVVILSSGCGDKASSNLPSQIPVASTESSAGGSAPVNVQSGAGGMPSLSSSGGVGGQEILGIPVGGTNSAVGAGGSAPTPAADVEEHALVVTPAGGCALDAKGAIQCWGGKFLAGTAPPGKFLALASFDTVVCAIREDRMLLCFVEPSDNSPGLPNGPIQGVSAVAVGGSEVLWLDESGKVNLGLDHSNFPWAGPPPQDERFSLVTSGYRFGCGLRKSDSAIFCWDAMIDRAPTDPACTTGDEVGQRDAPSGAFSDISTYMWTSCGVRATGELACWGAGKGLNPANPYPCDFMVTTTEAVPPPGKFRRVAMGLHYGCAVAEDGHVECWGNGTTDACTATSVECGQAKPPAGTFDQVAVSTYHSCAMTAGRKVTCWGYPGPAGGDGRNVPPVEFQ